MPAVVTHCGLPPEISSGERYGFCGAFMVYPGFFGCAGRAGCVGGPDSTGFLMTGGFDSTGFLITGGSGFLLPPVSAEHCHHTGPKPIACRRQSHSWIVTVPFSSTVKEASATHGSSEQGGQSGAGPETIGSCGVPVFGQ
jgi:hypothetical protein